MFAMPSLHHKLFIAFLRRFPIPDPIALGLNKNIVVRQAPTERQIKRYEISSSEFDGQPVWTFGTPKDGEPILYFCHGGGFVTGMFSAYYTGVSRLQRYLSYPVICPDYPMPPETDARGVVEFTWAHFKQVCESYPNSPLIIAGDSAGGHLSLTLSQSLSPDQLQNVAAIFPLFPSVDMRRDVATDMTFHKEEILLHEDPMHGLGERFVGTLEKDDPVVSPILGDFTHVPPIHIYSSDRDPLFPDAVDLKTVLDKIGHPATHHIFEGYGHDFVLFFPTLDSRRGLKRIADHIKICFRS